MEMLPKEGYDDVIWGKGDRRETECSVKVIRVFIINYNMTEETVIHSSVRINPQSVLTLGAIATCLTWSYSIPCM